MTLTFLLQNTAINMIGSPLLPATLSAGPNLTLYGRAWHSYWIDRLDTRQPDNSWQLFARVPLTNAVMVVSGAPKSWQAFRAYEFVAEPPILDIARTGPLAARLVVYGQTNRSIAVETTPSLDVLPAPWLPTGLGTGPMTNTFRIFPTFPATEAKRFYRARQLP